MDQCGQHPLGTHSLVAKTGLQHSPWWVGGRSKERTAPGVVWESSWQVVGDSGWEFAGWRRGGERSLQVEAWRWERVWCILGAVSHGELERAGNRLEIRLGRQPRARVGRAMNASLRSVRRAVCGHCSRCPAEFTHLMLMVAHGDFFNMLQVTQLVSAGAEILAPASASSFTMLPFHIQRTSLSFFLFSFSFFYIAQNNILVKIK